jgi:preprotein translocase subunit SecD
MFGGFVMFRICACTCARIRLFFVVIALALGAFLSPVVVAQSGLTVHAASNTPIAGWQQMKSAGSDLLWVAPTAALTSGDIVRAERSTRTDGRSAVAVVFTSQGASKIAALSMAQRDKPIAIVVDGVVVWAPIVRGSITNESLLTGGPEGLAPEVIERLLSSLNPR